MSIELWFDFPRSVDDSFPLSSDGDAEIQKTMKARNLGSSLLLATILIAVGHGVVWAQDPPVPGDGPKLVSPGGKSVEPTAEGKDPAETNAGPSKAPESRIAGGDVLIIKVKEDHQHLTRIYPVDGRGMIGFSYVGDVAVEGLTAEELAAKLKAKLEAEFLKTATVAVEVRSPSELPAQPGAPAQALPNFGTVWVMGQVNHKGPMSIPNKEFSVAKAILQAGVAQFAKISKTKVVRKKADGKTEEIIVNVFDVLYKGQIDKDIPVQKDDWIIVPEAFFPGPS
jgi:protein involved in polysaccharide export with SLBB domain